MNFQALLISKDSQASDILTRVLSVFGMGLTPCDDGEAVSMLREQKFDAVIVDFDGPKTAEQVLQSVQQSFSGERAVTVALLSDRSELRNLLRKGANFVLYKPLSEQSTEAALSAAASLVKRHRRSFRVPVQAPVQLRLGSGPEMEGILLDLSENGMHILAAQPLSASAAITARFTLPGTSSEVETPGEVTWTNPNGEVGVRFGEIPDDLRQSVKDWIGARSPSGPIQTPDPMPLCKLTDLSPSACYVETQAPFPEDSLLTLNVKAGEKETKSEAVVRVMHPGFGMGLEFVSESPDHPRERIGLIEFLTSQPGAVPEISIVPRALKAEDSASAPAKSEDSDDQLLDLLHRRWSVSQEEFLKELQSQRSGESVSA